MSQFKVATGIALPPRQIPTAGPRESKYPVSELEPGQAFYVTVADKDEARRKQSQFSSLAKTRGIALVTRFIQDDAGNPGFTDEAGNPAQTPFLAVWHDGPAKPKKERKSKAAAPAAPQAPEAPAAPASDDTVEL